MDTLSPHKLKIISWNITLRCPLRCSHCYSNAGEYDAVDLLTLKQAEGIMDQIRVVGSPLVILSGGEPMMHPDFYAIARYGTDIGLRMALGTSGYTFDENTPARLKEAGIKSVAISIDSATPLVHDIYRGCSGSWERAVHAVEACLFEGMQVQINMTVLTPDPDIVDEVVELGKNLGVRTYQLFIPVPTGRSQQENYDKYCSYEELLRHVLITYTGTEISIRPTCIPQFRRVADTLGIKNQTWGRGCIAGISYCRIYANGDVTPCPYLPAIAGNLLKTPLYSLWENSEVFAALRDYNRLGGKCGQCEYKVMCGGCRARSFSQYCQVTHACGSLVRPVDIVGELCAEDPLCPYTPRGNSYEV